MNIKGEVVRVFPSDTNTDEIISGKYKYDELDLNKLAKHTFESIDSHFYEDCQGLRNLFSLQRQTLGAVRQENRRHRFSRLAVSRASSQNPSRGYSTEIASTLVFLL